MFDLCPAASHIRGALTFWLASAIICILVGPWLKTAQVASAFSRHGEDDIEDIVEEAGKQSFFEDAASHFVRDHWVCALIGIAPADPPPTLIVDCWLLGHVQAGTNLTCWCSRF